MSDFYSLLLLCSLRIMVIISMNPVLGARILPGRARILLALGVSAYVSTGLAKQNFTQSRLWAPFVLSCMQELLIGTVLGLVSALIFYALAMAGDYTDVLRGQTMAQALDPNFGNMASQLQQLYLQMGIVLYFILGYHRLLIEALIHSYTVFPPGTMCGFLQNDSAQILLLKLTDFTGSIFEIALLLTAPAMITLLCIDVIMGLMNRMAPQMQVFQLGLSMKMWLALAILAMGFHEFAGEIARQSRKMLEFLFSILT
jgi:flagellar biosynthetic protein FliR